MNDDWQPSASLQALRQRDALMQSIRQHFQASNSLEVSTPSMSVAATTDPHIDSFTVTDAGKTLWMHTSPEFPMKRLLAAYKVDIHQIACVYRQNETGRHHNREFSLLEWYRVGFSLEQLIEEATTLINDASIALGQAIRSVRIVSYQDAVKTLCGVYPDQLELSDIMAVFTHNKRSFPDSLRVAVRTDDRVDRSGDTHLDERLNEWTDADALQALDAAMTLMVDEFIVNEFIDDEITVLIDYPASQASLARTCLHDNGQVIARRAEIFIGSVELANGFEELTDAKEQLYRFENDNRQRQQCAKPETPIDQRLIAALSCGIPDCAGMAMGLDRLLMVLTGHSELSRVMAFPSANA